MKLSVNKHETTGFDPGLSPRPSAAGRAGLPGRRPWHGGRRGCGLSRVETLRTGTRGAVCRWRVSGCGVIARGGRGARETGERPGTAEAAIAAEALFWPFCVVWNQPTSNVNNPALFKDAPLGPTIATRESQSRRGSDGRRAGASHSPPDVPTSPAHLLLGSDIGIPIY
jgi:hypothetical protein